MAFQTMRTICYAIHRVRAGDANVVDFRESGLGDVKTGAARGVAVGGQRLRRGGVRGVARQRFGDHRRIDRRVEVQQIGRRNLIDVIEPLIRLG